MSASKSCSSPVLSGWGSLAVLLGGAVVLAWISGEGVWASSFLESPRSPLVPVAARSPGGLLSASPWLGQDALLVGGLVLGAAASGREEGTHDGMA